MISVSTRTATAAAAGDTNVVTATARCPKSKHGHTTIFPVGGGFQETPPNAGSQGIVYESRLFGKTAWKVSAQISDTTRPSNEPVALTAYVYCSRGGHKPKTKSNVTSTTGLAGPSPIDSVSCPRSDQTLIAGGFISSLPVTFPSFMIRSLTPSKQSGKWQGSLFAGTSPTLLTTEAYCAKDVKARSASFGIASSANGAAPFSQVIQDTPCSYKASEKRSPVNGGFDIGARSTARLVVYESYKLAKTWRVGAVLGHTPADTAPVALGGYAYC